MTRRTIGRRRFVTSTAALSSAMVAAPFVRGAYAAGKLSIGFWDHWVPGANKGAEAVAKAWAEKEKVDLQIDFITSQGNKLILTAAAEAQARSGHDILHLGDLGLFPILRSARAGGRHHGAAGQAERRGQHDHAVPRQDRRQVAWRAGNPGRPVQGTDVTHRPPKAARRHRRPGHVSGRLAPKADNWTLDAFLKAAAACHKAGFPFGIGLGTTANSVDTCGAIFQSFGAELVNAKGDITVKSDNVKKALEYWKQLAAYLPPDAPAWDDASNNKAFVAGKTALILNPPSAWAVARRDRPEVAEQTWHHGMAAGPAGRYGPFTTPFWGIWNFSKNQNAAKSLLTALSQADAIESMVKASAGFDIPAFANLMTLKVWAEEGPPKGTLYHYADPYKHQILSIAAAPAPHKIAVQIYRQGLQTQMVVRYALRNEPMDKVLGFATNELEGYMRV